MLIVWLFVCLLAGISAGQQCYVNNITTYNTIPPSSKGGTVVRIGTIMSGTDVTSESLVRWAAHRINSDPAILPNISLEYDKLRYTSRPQTGNVAENIASALALSSPGVEIAITSIEDTNNGITLELLSTFGILTMDITSTSELYSSKQSFPYLVRTASSDYYQSATIISLLQRLNISIVAYCFTPDGFGLADLSTFQQLALTVNISVIPVQVDEYVANIADVRAVILNIPASVNILYMTTLIETNKYYGATYSLVTRLRNFEFIKGSILIAPEEFVNSTYSTHIAQDWALANSTMFPGSRTPTSWQGFDCVNRFATALSQLISHGNMPTSNFTNRLYQNVLENSTASTMQGTFAFAPNGDKYGKFLLYNIVSYPLSGRNIKLAAEMDWSANRFTQYANFTYYGGSMISPGLVSRSNCNATYCNFHGYCADSGICVCTGNYTGTYCEEIVGTTNGTNSTAMPTLSPTPIPTVTITTGGNAINIVAWTVPFCISLVLLVLGYVGYRYRRRQIVRLISERQASEISRAEFELLEKIGRGASGDVYRGIYRGTEVAVKSIAAKSANAAVVDEFHLESAIMCTLRHPNIVMFMGSCFDVENMEMFLVMELMQQGTLYSILRNPQITLSYDTKIHIASQAALGMNFLHEAKLIHRDLKTHNILLDKHNNVKISDFGITRFKEITKQKGQINAVGTIYYCAPEVLRNAHSFSEKSDCYSFGIVLHEIFHRKHPFGLQDPLSIALAVVQRGVRPDIDPASCPPDIQRLIRECWAQNPEDRPSMKQILARLRRLSNSEGTALQLNNNNIHFSDKPLYLVHTTVQAANTLWDIAPRVFETALLMLNEHVRSSLAAFEGYEADFDLKMTSFSLSFPTLQLCLNWCISIQHSIMQLPWPFELLQIPQTMELVSDDGTMLWRGLRMRVSIHVGNPVFSANKASGRMIYAGPVADRGKALLSLKQQGSIIASEEVIREISKDRESFIEKIEIERLPAGASDSIRQILPISLSNRTTAINPKRSRARLPHMLIPEDEFGIEMDGLSKWVEHILPDIPPFPWIVKWEEISIISILGKGPVCDYFTAKFRNDEVVVKVLTNQNINEVDLIKLFAETIILRKVNHENLLPTIGMCLDSNHICWVVEFMRKGNLTRTLVEDPIISWMKCLQIARSVAKGMDHLSRHPEPSLRSHSSLKSGNILLSSDWQVKISDYGSNHIKDLARAMTDVYDAAWIAPEILGGSAISSRASVYSFGMILYHLISRRVPFEGLHPIKIISKVTGGKRPEIQFECPKK